MVMVRGWAPPRTPLAEPARPAAVAITPFDALLTTAAAALSGEKTNVRAGTAKPARSHPSPSCTGAMPSEAVTAVQSPPVVRSCSARVQAIARAVLAGLCAEAIAGRVPVTEAHIR